MKLIEDESELPDDGEPVVLLCYRVVDMPIPSAVSDIRYCQGGCVERIWVSRSSPKADRLLCFRCAEGEIAADKDPKFYITRRQLTEIRAWMVAADKARRR